MAFRLLVPAALLCVAGSLGAQQRPPQRGDTALRQRSLADTARDTVPTPPPADPLTRLLNGFTWRNLGPAAYSGRVTAVAVPQPYHKTIYVGAAGGGVWKTSNAGVTWRQIGDSLGVQSIGDIAVAPSDTSIIWVGTGEKNSLRSQSWGNGVHVSTDGGRTWKHRGLADTKAIGRIVIHPTNPNIVYVAALGHLWGPNAERGVFRTVDGGQTWTKSLFVDDTTGAVDLVMDPTNPAVLYAAMWHRLRMGGSHMVGVGSGSGIYRTADGGRTWKRLTDPSLSNGLPGGPMGRISLAIASSRGRTVLFAMIAVDRGVTSPNAAPFGGVFRSEDGGEHWTQVNDLAANPHYYYDEIVIDPTNVDHVYALASPVLVSKDGGRSFTRDSLYNVHVDNHALWIDPADPGHMMLGNDGGFYTTWDGGRAWEHAALPIGQFYTVIVDSAQTPYGVCGGLQDNGVWCGPSRTRDSLGVTDADWYAVNGGDGMWVQKPWYDPHIVYSEWQFGSMSRLDLRTWKRDEIKPLSLDAGAEGGYDFTWGWTAPMLLSQHDSATLYVGANRLFRLQDRGARGVDWQILGPDMTRADRARPEAEGPNTSYHALFSIAESPRDANVLWTGSDDGLVWLSRDRGRTWTNLTANFPKRAPTRCFVSTIAASHHADGTAYLTYDCHHRDDYHPYVFRTTDFGRTWTEIVNGLPADGGSLTVFEHPTNARVLWVGTALGAYVSLDAGAHWHRFGQSLPPVPVEKFAMSYAAQELVVATHGRGLWIADVAPLADAADSLPSERAHLFPVGTALQFRYADTYPSFGSRPFVARNPARGAVITYWLRDAQTGPVDLLVTSAAGDTVRKLSGPGYAGLQHVTWDLTREKPRPRELGGPESAADLRRVLPGEYFVTMSVGGRKSRQRIVVQDWPEDRLGRVR